jgi:serine/threonine protein kinase
MSKDVKEIPPSIKSYKIEKEAYKLSNLTLYNGLNTDINEKVLIHVFPKETIKSHANEVTFMNNHVYLMKLLNHKNILKLYEIIESKTHAFLIYEYFEGEKLSDYISKKNKLTDDEAIIIFKEILSALVYLHDMYVCNLNLNSNNIIIDANHNIKICDFKFGHFYSPKEKSRATLLGDHSTTCPELHSKKPYNPELADMWSCGVVLYQMVTGQLPFKSKKDLDMIRSIIKGEYSIPNSVSANMKTLITGLMEIKDDKRLKIDDLFNQQIIKDKNITKASLTRGLNVLVEKYPIDGVVLNICKNNFGFDVAKTIKNLENNRFTPITSLFKQIVTKLSRKGIQTINNLC